jgi:hypothetical protein
VLVLLVLVLAGFAVRVDDLPERQMSHMEIFTPGLSYEPAAISVPHPRRTLRQTLLGSLAEPHPPGWYLAMYPWTQIAGTSLFALRFPSVVAGTLIIVAVYFLGTLHGRPAYALVAAALVAFNGTLVLWSQIARPYIVATLLGLIATYLLLVLVATERGRAERLLGAYLATLLAGMLTNHYFWILAGTHLLWVLVRSRERPALLPALARWQMGLFILGSPLVCLVIYQAYRPSYLDVFNPHLVVHFFSFGFLHDEVWLPTQPYALPDAVRRLVLPLTALALWLAAWLAPGRLRVEARGERSLAPPPVRPLVMVTVLATLVCTVAWYLGAARILPSWIAPESRRVVPAIAVPAALLAATFALEPASRVLAAARGWFLFASPIVTLAIVPTAIVLALSVLVVPFQATRHQMVFAPYVSLVLAYGMTTLARRGSPSAAAAVVVVLVALLVPAHWASVVYHRAALTSPRDYRGLAQQWLPVLGPDDLVFVREDWRTTPLFYHVEGARFRYVAGDYAEAIRREHAGRVWLVGFYELPPSDEARAAVTEFRRGRVFTAREATVEEYVRPAR